MRFWKEAGSFELVQLCAQRLEGLVVDYEWRLKLFACGAEVCGIIAGFVVFVRTDGSIGGKVSWWVG